MAIAGERRTKAAAKGDDEWIGGQKFWVARGSP